jgi:signal transduction histidine kinase
MTSQTTPHISDHTLAAATLVAALIAFSVVTLIDPDLSLSGGVGHLTLWAIGMASLAWATMKTQARNREVWTLAVAGVFAALVVIALTVFALTAPEEFRPLPFDELMALTPSDLPLVPGLALNWYSWGWAPAFFVVLTVGLLWFPDGQPPTPRWQWVAWATLAILILALPLVIWTYRPSGTVPYSYSGDAGDVGVLVSVAALVTASVASLVVRYRRSSGAVRHQIRWIAWAGAFLGGTMLLLILDDATTLVNVSESAVVAVLGVAELLVIAAFWIAITRYRLYDIDVVVSRTVTYGALAIFITALYVAIVVGLGNLFGQGDNPNLVLRIGAIAAIALLFEPVRSRVQRWANRLVYGRRATPYEVLARFSSGAATETDDEVLERIPRLIVDGTGATRATLWKVDGERMRPEAWWPDDATPPAPSGPVVASWSDPAADYSVIVGHRGEILGGLSLVAGRGESLAPAEEELMQNLAGGLGLAMRNARLTDDLRHRVAALAESRERILTAADEARRDLERDLDMGPQQELVAVKVKLGVVRSRAARQDATQTAEVLGQLEQEVGTAITSVRDFARGIYPPLLEADGLTAAVSAEGDKAAFPVTIEADGVRRYSREVETAVFFTVLEALQNAAKYADPTSATIKLVDDGRRLSFDVVDDGSGFDPRIEGEGSGIPGMRDRIDAAGGELAVASTLGGGTTISGAVPVNGPHAPA